MLPRRRRQASGGTARAGPVFPTKGGGHRGGAAGTPWRLGRSCHPTQLASQLASQLAAQQCTQMPQNSSEGPFSPICVHFCVPTSVRNGATVYTNVPKQLREAVSADLCTLLCPHGHSRDRAGPWVPRHRRLHGPRDARALGPEVRAARAVTQPSTYMNSRSLVI